MQKIIFGLPEKEAEKLIPLEGKVVKRKPLFPPRSEMVWVEIEIDGQLVGTDEHVLYGDDRHPVIVETAYEYITNGGRVFYVNYQTDAFPRVEFRRLEEIYHRKTLCELCPEVFSERTMKG